MTYKYLSAAARCALAALLLASLAGCFEIDFGGLPTGLPDPTASTPSQPLCSSPSAFEWIIEGFWQSDVGSWQSNLVVEMQVGQEKSLRVSTSSRADCSSKVVAVEWLLSNPSVATVADTGEHRLLGTLRASSPGETTLGARLRFVDGTEADAQPLVWNGSQAVPVPLLHVR